MYALRYHEPGGTDVLQYEEVERPTPDHGEVLVEMRAASVNPIDALLREARPPAPVKTTGSDLAGVVVAVGPTVEGYSEGDRVVATGLHTGRFTGGSFAEYATVPTDLLAPLPEVVPFETGAAVALVGVTAWRAFVHHAGVEPGDTVLVHGGNGGVGHVAVQLARAMGATVACTARPAYHEALSELGADAVVDYTREDLVEAVRDAVGPVDVVLDHRPQEYIDRDIEVAAFGADLVFIADGEVTIADTLPARGKELDMHWMSMSNLATHAELPDIGPILERVVGLVADGDIEVHIDRSYPLADGADAHRAVTEESFLGKLVVTL
ncbi:quinone oxidoreductase family protein [Natronomonas sp. EA1]|uniref:quinone oxidoreductase family protein n=1 Tax=Natronomonas sp. EA1 TaxID=3421655 RepID=UPI003EBFBA33